MKAKLVFKGGKGSGNFGHAGRPGKVGGSAAGSGGGGAAAAMESNFNDTVADTKTRMRRSEGYKMGVLDVVNQMVDSESYEEAIGMIDLVRMAPGVMPIEDRGMKRVRDLLSFAQQEMQWDYGTASTNIYDSLRS